MFRCLKNMSNKKIIKNYIYEGIPFKVNNHGVIPHVNFIQRHYEIDDDQNDNILYCISNISYNLYIQNIPHKFIPPKMINNGWCIQHDSLLDYDSWWTLSNIFANNIQDSKPLIIDSHEYLESSSNNSLIFASIKNTHTLSEPHSTIKKINYIPCIELDELDELKHVKIRSNYEVTQCEIANL